MKAERLVIISDMWGAKKGLWITSYLGYLQQYYDIVFYDVQQLANLDIKINSEKNIHEAFVGGGIDTAVAHLLKRETQPSHYLAFSTGGTVLWKAAAMGLPVKSIYAVSATRVRYETVKPKTEVTLVYGEKDEFRPAGDWFGKMKINADIIQNFGHTLYTDEKMIKSICKDLLGKVTHSAPKYKKAV